MTMRESLVRELRRRWLTPLDALERCQCLSLSQRCGDLRRAGVNVVSRWVDLAGGKRVKAYRIVGGGA